MPIIADKKPQENSTWSYLKLFQHFGLELSSNGNTGQLLGRCPFCDRDEKFYIDEETSKYYCQVCGQSGNQWTYLRVWFDEQLEHTTDDRRRLLKDERGFTLQTIKRHSIALARDENAWLIPSFNPSGEVVNCLRYFPGRKVHNKRNLPALPTVLWGLHELSDDCTRDVFVCEGALDGIALDGQLREKKTRERYDILATPSAGTFKPKWAELLEGRTKVRLLYDAGDAGTKGQQHTASVLHEAGFKGEVTGLYWPPEYEDGHDVGDLVQQEVSVVEFSAEHSRTLNSEQKLVLTRASTIAKHTTRWMDPYLLPFGSLVDLNGDMGTAKSLIAKDYVARCTAGLAMPVSGEVHKPFDCVYFTAEDSVGQVRDLVELHGGDLERLHIFDGKTQQIDLLKWLTSLEAEVCTLGARVVVIDPVSSFIGGSNRTDDMCRRTQSGPLVNLAARTGALVIIIRNWGRANPKGSASQKATGGMSLACAGRATMWTEKHSLGKTKWWTLDVERMSDAPEIGTRYLQMNDMSGGDKSKSHLRQLVWLEENPAVTAVKKVAEKGSKER